MTYRLRIDFIIKDNEIMPKNSRNMTKYNKRIKRRAL